MKFTFIITLLSAVALRASAVSVYVTYDYTYGNSDGSLNNVACSNGANGLLSKGYTTFGSLPSFPYLGGVPGASWNSTLCGSCWAVKYAMPNGTQNTIYITAVDLAATFNLSPEAFGNLTDGTGFAPGKVRARAVQVNETKCGL
ncbi:Cerato-platanin [Rhizopogon vinicolor AM-OR11-026]|uniref:Cerato-platanin n=1 Tax=Rhizopogon vinicolor AM-OR11-026 TaxID=1314800 RepID=A0A1B7N7Y2_9AGAM|nr:Cerato-platanin [Rhizopogon vinicolor AM-OR11-026]